MESPFPTDVKEKTQWTNLIFFFKHQTHFIIMTRETHKKKKKFPLFPCQYFPCQYFHFSLATIFWLMRHQKTKKFPLFHCQYFPSLFCEICHFFSLTKMGIFLRPYRTVRNTFLAFLGRNL